MVETHPKRGYNRCICFSITRYERKVASCLNIIPPAAIRAGLPVKDPFTALPVLRTVRVLRPAPALPARRAAVLRTAARREIVRRVQDPPEIARLRVGPAPRRRKRTQPRFFVILAAIVIVLVLALVLILSGRGGDDIVVPQSTPVPASSNSGMSNATVSTQSDVNADEPAAADETNAQGEAHSTLADWLGDEDAELQSLSADEMVKVSDLSVNTSLPSDWKNILLLGTDNRTLNESARTDSMIICSINPTTGEVKLTSIMRDLAVKLDDIGKYSGTYRINSANYFGGPEYAIKTVNECFDMNIEYYVMVNFFGFQKIAQALGGIEVDITEAEMEQINKNAVAQAWNGYNAGIDESDQINEYLTTYGANTHLNGRQTLAYARIRYTDSDFSRADRQRQVLTKLMNKLKGKSVAEIIALAGSLSDQVTTNMDINAILEIALKVVESGVSSVDTLRLPVNDTYVQERRNEQEMFYDCDWAANALELYNFIYE